MPLHVLGEVGRGLTPSSASTVRISSSPISWCVPAQARSPRITATSSRLESHLHAAVVADRDAFAGNLPSTGLPRRGDRSLVDLRDCVDQPKRGIIGPEEVECVADEKLVV